MKANVLYNRTFAFIDAPLLEDVDAYAEKIRDYGLSKETNLALVALASKVVADVFAISSTKQICECLALNLKPLDLRVKLLKVQTYMKDHSVDPSAINVFILERYKNGLRLKA
jgi:hypothetical protein